MKFLLYCNLDICTDDDIEQKLIEAKYIFRKVGEHAWVFQVSREDEEEQIKNCRNLKVRGNPFPDIENVFYSYLNEYCRRSTNGAVIIDRLRSEDLTAHSDESILNFINSR